MTTAMDTFSDEEGVLRAKIITMICLFLVSMSFGLLPLLLSLKFDWFTKAGKDVRSNRLVVGLLAFGGGVLFATTFMHLLPEVDDNIDLLEESGDLAEFPIYLAGLIMCSGFFMMYLIEELVHVYINSRQKSASSSFSRVLSIRRNKPDEDTNEARDVEVKGHTAHTHGAFPGIEREDESFKSAMRGLLIVLALSIHELFEGLAVGLESSTANVWYMFGAVSAHKYLIAFCIGVELLAAGTKRWLQILYIFTFSFVSALGIGIGILMVGGGGAADIWSVVLQGLAAGTLIYVIFFEVWRAELKGIMTFLCSLCGFSLMVVLQLIVEFTVAID